MSEPRVFVLMGPSCVGKTSVLRHLQRTIRADAAPKYTTRESRGTVEDEEDFIFCCPSEFPESGVLSFESYGCIFGIQIDTIHTSLRSGNSHVVVVDGCNPVRALRLEFGESVVTILVYCDRAELQRRVWSDSASRRVQRWPAILDEIASIYDQLGCVDHIVNNSGSLAETQAQVDRLVSLLR